MDKDQDIGTRLGNGKRPTGLDTTPETELTDGGTTKKNHIKGTMSRSRADVLALTLADFHTTERELPTKILPLPPG
jgi:hypothetical protein